MSKVKREKNFSSSQAYRLINPASRPMTEKELALWKQDNPKSKKRNTLCYNTLDSVAHTYIKEKNREIRACTQIQSESNTRPLIWGKIMERYVINDADKMSVMYKNMNLEDRLSHKTLPWTGIPDVIIDNAVGDQKSPWTLTSYYDKIEAIEAGFEAYRKEIKEDYWQLVSNSILANKTHAEALIFVPKPKEFKRIKDFIDNFDGDKELSPFQVEWISVQIRDYLDFGTKPTFPYLGQESKDKSLVKYRFEIPQSDKELLTKRVQMASKLLNN